MQKTIDVLVEQQIFEKMKAKDFGESMCNETKLNVLKWTMQQLRKHDVSGMFSSEKLEQAYKDGVRDALAKGYGTFDEENYR